MVDLRFEDEALFNDEAVIEQPLQPVVELGSLELGEEPEVPEVDPEQWDTRAPDRLGRAQQRSVAAEDDHEVEVLRHRRGCVDTGETDAIGIAVERPHANTAAQERLDERARSGHRLVALRVQDDAGALHGARSAAARITRSPTSTPSRAK